MHNKRLTLSCFLAGCALAGYPGVNVEVSYFIDWIKDKMAAEGLSF
jgi:secreted trypsin-like serine protease